MKVKELGEFGLIDRIARRIRLDNSVVVGIGDDAAVIRWKPDRYLLFASDMIIEMMHFDLRYATPFGIGWKALAVNISDIAAMGGMPRYASISLGLPRGLSVKFVDGIYSGLKNIARRFNVNIVGGDTDSSDRLILDVAIIGEVKKDELVLRRGAKRGDTVFVTGRLGGSIKGRHLNFTPRIEESQFLVRNFRIDSMIDISDGLSSDLIKICRASSAGCLIYESLIPLSKDAASIKNALNDGEDFELLFTVAKGHAKDLIKRFKRRFKTPISAIGEMTDKKKGVMLIDRYGRAHLLKEGGFSHF